MEIHLIENQEDVVRCLPLIAEHEAIGIDTEFDNNRIRYGFTLCVIQIAVPGHCFIIDTLKFSKTTIQAALQPIWDLIASEKVLKVIFSGSEDWQIFSEYCPPRHFFDLSVAARLLGFGYPSLGALLKDLLNEDADKDLQVSDWYQRPFTPQMISYLAGDTIFLLPLWELLRKQLEQKNRVSWMEEEMESLLSDVERPSREERLEKVAMTKFKTHIMPDFEAFVTKKIIDLRDTFAQKYNIPVHYVFSNERLTEMVQELPALLQLRDWKEAKGIHRELKTTDNLVFKQQLRHILHAAQEQQLSKTHNTHYQRPKNGGGEFDKRAFGRFADFMSGIQQRLAEKYGEAMQQILLSNTHVKKIFQAQSWEAIRRYALNEIVEAGKELGKEVLKQLKTDN